MSGIQPNQTDRLLSVIEAIPIEELQGEGVRAEMRKHEEFSSFARSRVIESLAHLSTNGRIVYDPNPTVTDAGLQRLVDVGLLAEAVIEL